MLLLFPGAVCGRRAPCVRQADDRSIKEEGLDNLSEEELRSACRARGMRAPFGEGAATFMRRQMAEWLDLSLNRRAPRAWLPSGCCACGLFCSDGWVECMGAV